MRSKVTTQPAIEPVTLQELKDSLRITNSAEDTLLTQFIEDARIYCENYTGQKFITQTITAYYDNMIGELGEWWTGTRMGSVNDIYGEQHQVLEYGPAQSITTVHTIDQSNSETLYTSTNYYLDDFDHGMRPKMILNVGSSITTNLRPKNNVKIVYVAGYGDAGSDVPSAIRRSILVMAGQIYANRGDCNGECAEECGAHRMLEQYRYKNTHAVR